MNTTTMTIDMATLLEANYLKSELQEISQTRYEDKTFAGQLWENGVYKDVTFINCHLQAITIKNCKFENCQFLNCTVEYGRITDSEFKNCQFYSNSVSFTSVNAQFTGCEELNTHALLSQI